MAKSLTSQRVFKALGVFGSLQVVNILCSVVRTKCIAVWLGTAGIGIFALYNTTLDVINQLVQLNLRQSGVREIANAPSFRFNFIVAVVRRMGTLLGVIGALLTLFLSPLLSRFTFGDDSHTMPFILLSTVVFLNAMVAGEQAVLQASDRLRRLASASMWGGVVATVVSIALIKYAGFDGILPSIIVYSVVTAVAFYLRRESENKVSVSVRETLRHSTAIIRLGTYMTAAMFVSSLSQYIFIVWLRSQVDSEGVGIYQSGYMIVNQYVGLIFTAMAYEFFPRLSRVSSSRFKVSIYVKHEVAFILVALLGAIPLFINMVPVIIDLLYERSFLVATDYVTIASVGTVFRAFSFVLAFVILARADGKIYILTETVSSVLYIILNIAGYHWWGYAGVGLAYVVWYMLYLLSVTLVYCLRYGNSFADLSRQYLLSVIVVAVVAAQSALCTRGHYLAATVVSCTVVPVSGFILYRWFLKRRTLKE
ncbi:MAG: oligosaccharide flippase family protein [Clostridiales bacterium]|nr:oligosaccharide flippase family protein [Clostridiales bacterium]